MKPKNPFISMLSRSIRRSTLSNFSVTARSFAKDVKPKKKVVKASAPPVTPTPIEQPAKVVRERKEKPKFDYVGADAVTWYNEFHRKASKKTNKIRLGDLKKVLLKVEAEPQHIKLAFDGIDLIQSRGDDFSRETCSIFVQLCLKNGKIKEAAELLSKREHRLSAYVCYKPYAAIMDALTATGDVQTMIDMTKTLIFKGAHIQPEYAAETLIKSAATTGDSKLYEDAVKTVSKIVPEADLTKLQDTHKLIAASN